MDVMKVQMKALVEILPFQVGAFGVEGETSVDEEVRAYGMDAVTVAYLEGAGAKDPYVVVMPGAAGVVGSEYSADMAAADWEQEERDVDLVGEEEPPKVVKLNEAASVHPEMHQEKEWIEASQPQHLEWFPHFESNRQQMVPELLVPRVSQN